MNIAPTRQSVTVVGAGIIGLWQALMLARNGCRVRLVEASTKPFTASASRWAGAMIAPECEAEAAPQAVRDLGRDGLAIWKATYPALVANGTLVVAASRDQAELTRFARLTENHQTITASGIAKLEPALSGRFDKALLFAGEAHLDAGAAMAWLMDQLVAVGVDIVLPETWSPTERNAELIIDCRGMAARDNLKGMRGVRGERIMIEARDLVLARPVRLLHPRQPIYVVPQGDGRFVVGATVIEREDDGPMTIKSALDLLGSAYALHPGFGEAAILDMGAGVRPAFADNVPHIVVENAGRIIRVNGAYRHGFLLAPVLAQAVAAFVADGARHELFV